MARTDVDPAEVGPGMFYFFLNSVVVPRPIAWVSSRSPSGVDNLAPHSFFTVSSVDPPIVQFTSIGRKDSLKNIERTGEFVVCLAPAAMIEQINASATDFPPEISEFDAVGVEREPSLTVAPPRVAASPVALECVLHSTVSFGVSTVARRSTCSSRSLASAATSGAGSARCRRSPASALANGQDITRRRGARRR